MITENSPTRSHYLNSPWKPNWLPSVEIAGESQIPKIFPYVITPGHYFGSGFTRPISRELRKCALMHGYLDDSRLMPMFRKPSRYMSLAIEHEALITPDYSSYISMPRFERILSTWRSRAVGAYFQYRGLNVIPNLRWANLDDLEFVCAGVSQNSTISISTQSLNQDQQLMQTFEIGLQSVMNILQPEVVVLYGGASEDIRNSITRASRLIHLPTDIGRVFSERAA